VKKYSLLLSLSLIFFSCEKDKLLNIENTDILLISEVLIGGEIYMEYSYNSVNLVAEEKSKFHYSEHFYNGINQLVRSDFYWDPSVASSNSAVLEAGMNRREWVSPENTPKSISHSLEYNSKRKLIRKKYILPSGESRDIVEFQYKNDRIVRASGNNNNPLSGYTDYEYDNNGNLTRQTKYIRSSAGIAELRTTTEYEYDNLHNPYQSFKRLMTPGIYTNPNNIIKETYTINFEVDPSIEKVQITENIYEYNDRGYPVKINGIIEYVYK